MPPIDLLWMQRCIELSYGGSGKVAPNPLVGSVIVYNGRIIGEGFHQQYGGPHAEVNAIGSVKPEDRHLLSQSTLYVNLEPCSHIGKTPPCADLIIKNQIPHVVVGMDDPNPLVAGKGIEKLRLAGCVVEVGVMMKECQYLNRRFVTWMQKQRPYIILKWAQSADGFMGKQGEEVPLTNHFSRTLVHKWRSEEAAILVGTETAWVDDPVLDSRLWNQRNPVRMVLDRKLRLPKSLHLLDGRIPTLVFTEVEKESVPNISWVVIDFENRLPQQMLATMYAHQLQSVIIEGGQKLLQLFIDHALWDEARIFMAPALLGSGIATPKINVAASSKEQIGDDELFIQYPSP